MSLFKDMILVQKTTLKKSLKSLLKNWPIIFTGIVYFFLNAILMIVVTTLFRGVLSILAGLAIAIVTSSLTSNYLYLLFNIINYNRISLDNFKEGFTYYLRKIYRIFFIAWIVSYLLTAVGRMIGSNLAILNSLFGLAILVGLNALPETIYQKHYSSGESIKYAFEFIKENWLNWFVPNIILFVIIYVVTGRLILNMFATHVSFDIGLSPINIISYIIGQALFSFTMIYRGHLFKILSTSTRRKRMYMNKLYD